MTYLAIAEPGCTIRATIDTELGNIIWEIVLPLSFNQSYSADLSKIKLQVLVLIFSYSFGVISAPGS